jgi:hypothetical protein
MRHVLSIIACVAFCELFPYILTTLLLGMVALCTWLRTSALAGPLAQSQLPVSGSLTKPPPCLSFSLLTVHISGLNCSAPRRLKLRGHANPTSILSPWGAGCNGNHFVVLPDLILILVPSNLSGTGFWWHCLIFYLFLNKRRDCKLIIWILASWCLVRNNFFYI